MTWKEWQVLVQQRTEAFLTARKRKKLQKQLKQKQRPPLIEWTLIILEVVFIVIIINLFLFQNYRIPSESMVPELKIGDLIFVEKITFGPEILPGQIKLPAWQTPYRGEVVSFESTSYALHGPWIEFWDRFVYMITLTMVNLKVDKNHQPVKDLLIKRVIGLPGERIRLAKTGGMEILPQCEDKWLPEKEFMKQISHFYINQTDSGNELFSTDRYLYNYRNTMDDYQNQPYNINVQINWFRQHMGWYIPEDRFFPMGDNRNRSYDAREYGPVPLHKIQGKALFRWLPFGRIGAIR
ncbi:MAG: signal peptidase I [Spirochaetia bacterium]|jgi:signal peptidase I